MVISKKAHPYRTEQTSCDHSISSLRSSEKSHYF
jgi:hypothetical protein